MERKVQKATKRLSAQELKQREVTRNFNHVAKLVLTPLEREALHKSIRSYQKNRDVGKLHQMMTFLLSTPEKQKLFPYVRSMIVEDDRQILDDMTLQNREKPKVFLHPNSAVRRRSSTSYNKNVQVININNRAKDDLGLSIRGGAEYGLGIYISQVDPLSLADYSGLEVGDEIMEVNTKQFDNVTLSKAVYLLTESRKLRIVINRMRKVPEWKRSKERTIWYNVKTKKFVPLPADERMMDRQTVRERQVVLAILHSSDYVGMNIRGGNEYGLGIYVSSLDRGGLAERFNVCVGDQIVAVNGTSFENVNHSSAVEFLRAHISLKLTLKAVGRYPAFKEVYQEYTWSENTNKTKSSPSSDYDYDTRFVITDTKITSKHNNSKPTKSRNKSAPPSQRYQQQHLVSQHDILLPRQNDVFYSSPHDEWTSSGFDEEHKRNSGVSGIRGHNSRRGRITKHSVSDYTDSSQSEEDDYTTFLERRSREELQTIQQNYQRPEAITSFIYPEKQEMADDFTVKTFILPDQHTTSIYSSEPDIHVTNSYLEYAQVPNSKQLTTFNVSNLEPYRTHQQTSFQTQGQVKSRSMSSLVSVGKSNDYQPVSAYDSFERRKVHDGQLSEPSIDYSLNSTEAAVHHVDTNQLSKAPAQEVRHHNNMMFSELNNDVIDNTSILYANLSDDDEHSSVSVQDRIKNLENHKSNLKTHEIENITRQGGKTTNKNLELGHNSKKNRIGSWSSLKKKFKTSQKTKSKKKEGEEDPVLKRRERFESPFGSQMINNHYVDNYNMMMLEEKARALLPEDECKAVIRHVKNYHETKVLETLLDLLLQILDTPEKLQLLKDVRGVIFPFHIGLFDNKVNVYEIKEYDRTSTKLHLPLHHNNIRVPHKNLITTVIDDGGHFHIKTVDQHDRDVEHEKKVIKVMRSSVEVDSDSDSNSDDVRQQSYDLIKPWKKRDISWNDDIAY